MTTARFNDPAAVVPGWHWACRSREIRRGKVRALRLLGRELAVFRGEDGRLVALDAYCAHMGAHLAEGRVEGNHLRCFFHQWRYDGAGRVDDIPCLRGAAPPGARVRTWPVDERYGLVWIWTGSEATHDVPGEPELAAVEHDFLLVNRFRKNCHPNVVLINAIDEQHFHSVHHLPGSILNMQATPESVANIRFDNIGRLSAGDRLGRLFGRYYRGALTYRMSYWYGSLGFVTLGPDFLHFHLLFALRRGDDGETIGQTIALTRRRRGPLGWLANRAILGVTALLAAYFARGDTRVFQTIRFDLRNPIGADRAVSAFIRHFEQQPLADEWTDEPATSAAAPPLRRVAGGPA